MQQQQQQLGTLVIQQNNSQRQCLALQQQQQLGQELGFALSTVIDVLSPATTFFQQSGTALIPATAIIVNS
jgi:hypothetical protein